MAARVDYLPGGFNFKLGRGGEVEALKCYRVRAAETLAGDISPEARAMQNFVLLDLPRLPAHPVEDADRREEQSHAD